MKILLTGATGLVGQELGLLLVRQGHSLHVLTRNPAKHRGMLPFPAKLFAWDASTAAPPQEAFSGVEAVIHLAGESIASGRWTEERRKSIRDSRVTGTRLLVEGIREAAARGERISSFLSASAVGIYGDRGDEELVEDSRVEEGSGEDPVSFLASVCRDWEHAATDGLPSTVRGAQIRIGIVLSSQGAALAQMLPIFRKGIGGPLGSGRQWMSWIHVVDLARLFEHVLSRPELSGPINGVSPGPVSNRDFSKTLGSRLSRPAVLPAPGAALRVALGGVAQAVLSSQRVLPVKAGASGFVFRFPALDGALADLIPQPANDQLLVRQWIPAGIEPAFDFFSNARNLERITPPFLNFEVVGMSTAQIQQGSLIDYRLKLHGVPVKWRTLIESWEPRRMFVDTQLKGPYQLWHHTHRFEELAGGVLIEDQVFFRLPIGWLGDLVAGAFVRSDVEKIFDYRREVIAGIFSPSVA